MKLLKFIKLRAGDQKVVVEAVLMLLSTKIHIKMFGVKSVCKKLKYLDNNVEPDKLQMSKDASKVLFGILAGSANVPWKSVCLDQSIACAMMLQRRQIPFKICFGVKANDADNKLDAHSWIEFGDIILLGGQRSKDYIPVVHFDNNWSKTHIKNPSFHLF